MKINTLQTTIPSAIANKENAEIRAVANDFESLFVNYMLKVMKDNVNRSDLLPEAPGRKVYESMLDEEYAKTISEKKQFGISDMVYNYLVERMNVQNR